VTDTQRTKSTQTQAPHTAAATLTLMHYKGFAVVLYSVCELVQRPTTALIHDRGTASPDETAIDYQTPPARLTSPDMARMTPAEANAVNVVLGYLVGKGDQPPSQVVKSLEMLASRAHNRIQTGWDEAAVRRQRPYAYEDDAFPDSQR
jgi:hypothetical protein